MRGWWYAAFWAVLPLYGMLYYLPNIIAQLILTFLTQVGIAQKEEVTAMGRLPEGLDECSGMVALAPNRLVMINDSGHEPILWVLDTLGQLRQKLALPGLENRDWESLAHNDSLLFVGDIGNNGNDRRDLCIYLLRWGFTEDSLNLQARGKLAFHYRDQRRFPPSAPRRHYDAEALIAVDDSLYIFTKSRAKPFHGLTYCYGLPARPGRGEASRLDSFITGPGVRLTHWVSAADYDAAQQRLALLSYNRIWVFEQARPPHFFAQRPETIALGFFSQLEGMTWRHSGGLWLGNERNNKQSGRLYRVRPMP